MFTKEPEKAQKQKDKSAMCDIGVMLRITHEKADFIRFYRHFKKLKMEKL